jgi:signal peptidase
MDIIRLASNILTALFVMLLLVAVIVIMAPFTGWHLDAVLSGSMEPTIPTGSLVVLGPVSAGEVHVGDIIAYNKGNVKVCHRVISVEDGQSARFITKGDANNAPDGTPVAPEELTGKLALCIPLAGYVTQFMKTPLGLFLTILLPLLFLVGTELKKLIFDEKEDATRGGK